MKLCKTLAMILAFALLLSVSAYAAGQEDTGAEGASETDATLAAADEAAPEEGSPTDMAPAADTSGERVPADHIVLDGSAGRIELEGVTMGSAGDVLIESVPAGDGQPGEPLAVRLTDAVLQGDILHGDGQRAMELSLAGTRLEGAVTGPAPGAPAPEAAEETEAETGSETAQVAEAAVPAASEQKEAEEAVPAADTAPAEEQTSGQAAEKPAAGVHMALDSGSVWVVTGPSSLASLTLEEGAAVEAAAGGSLAVYVNCAVDAETGTYDAETGSYISALVPGVQYEEVALVVTGQEQQPEAGTDIFAALGVDTALVDGDYSVALESFLETMGVQVIYDEQSGTLTITNADEVLDMLSGAEE